MVGQSGVLFPLGSGSAFAVPFLLMPTPRSPPAAVIGAQAQQQRLRALFPELVPAEDAPAAAYPSPFLRAFALPGAPHGQSLWRYPQ